MRRYTTGVVLVGVVAVGCTPQQGEPDPGASEPTDHSAAPEETAEHAALETYESMWDVLVEESHRAEPDYSGLELYASGDAFALVRHGLGAETEDGVVSRGEPTFSPEVVADEEDRAEIEDCMDSTAWLREDSETGELVEPSPEGPLLRRVDATVTFDGLSWKVTDLQIWEIGSCDV